MPKVIYSDESLGSIATSEAYKPTRYIRKDNKGKAEAFPTIGYGHYIDNEKNYSVLSKALAFKNPENLSTTEALSLLRYDMELRRNDMLKKYPDTPKEVLDRMLTVRMQFSPKGFDRLFGESLKKNDIGTVQETLNRVGIYHKGKGDPGVYTRWMQVVDRLNDDEVTGALQNG